MRFLDLQTKIKTNLFSLSDIGKFFPDESPTAIKTQIYRFRKKSLIKKIKKGLYCFDISLVEEFFLANLLVNPSYISLETALNYYGLMPDIPQFPTSVTVRPTKTLKTTVGEFYYHQVKPELFFGFQLIKSKETYLRMAKKEKALLDYIYIRKIHKLEDLRIKTDFINRRVYNKYLNSYPCWVKQIKLT